MKVIALDVMGADLGLTVAVQGAINFVQVFPDYQVILVGDEVEILKALNQKVPAGLSIHHASTFVASSASLSAARDSETSLAQALKLVRDGKAAAVMSAGNSGVYIGAATIILERLNGVRRPAFMPVIPALDKARPFVLLDAGANLEATAEMLVQWARLGSAFMAAAYGREKPSVALLNVGTEAQKGLSTVREAHALLTDTTLNYLGFIEARDLLLPAADVVVVDGYGGNLIVKNIEGTFSSIFKLLRQEISAKFSYKLGALLARGAFRKVRDRYDYRHVGAAWVIGLNGLVAKCHGASDELAFLSGLSLVRAAIESKTLESLKAILNIEIK